MRLAALLLVPCLVLDPSMASGTASALGPRNSPGTATYPWASQALSPRSGLAAGDKLLKLPLTHLSRNPFRVFETAISRQLFLRTAKLGDLRFLDTYPAEAFQFPDAWLRDFIESQAKSWPSEMDTLILNNLRFMATSPIPIGPLMRELQQRFLPTRFHGQAKQNRIVLLEAVKNAVIWGNSNAGGSFVALRKGRDSGDDITLDVIDQGRKPIDFDAVQAAPPEVPTGYYGLREGFKNFLSRYIDPAYFKPMKGLIYDFPLRDSLGNRIGQVLRLQLPYHSPIPKTLRIDA